MPESHFTPIIRRFTGKMKTRPQKYGHTYKYHFNIKHYEKDHFNHLPRCHWHRKCSANTCHCKETCGARSRGSGPASYCNSGKTRSSKAIRCGTAGSHCGTSGSTQARGGRLSLTRRWHLYVHPESSSIKSSKSKFNKYEK